MGIRNVLLAWGKGEAGIRYVNRSCAALGFVGKHWTCFMLWKAETIHVHGLGKGSGKMQWPKNTRVSAMALFLLLKKELKTTSTEQLFCLPFNCSFPGNCQFGLFAMSPLHFMKALQSPNDKGNISKTEMIYHLERDILDPHSLLFKYSVQLKDWEPHHSDLRHKVHLYLCLHKSETSLFTLLFPHNQKNQRLCIYGREAWSSLVKIYVSQTAEKPQKYWKTSNTISNKTECR